MLTVSTAVALGALQRKESRGGHAREDCPQADREMGKVNVVQGQKAERGPYAPITICPEPLSVMPAELAELFEEATDVPSTSAPRGRSGCVSPQMEPATLVPRAQDLGAIAPRLGDTSESDDRWSS